MFHKMKLKFKINHLNENINENYKNVYNLKKKQLKLKIKPFEYKGVIVHC